MQHGFDWGLTVESIKGINFTFDWSVSRVYAFPPLNGTTGAVSVLTERSTALVDIRLGYDLSTLTLLTTTADRVTLSPDQADLLATELKRLSKVARSNPGRSHRGDD